MKKLMVVAAFLLTSSAYACPVLTGNYTCTINGESQDGTVIQSEANGVTEYRITLGGSEWSPLVTDGVERDFLGVSGMEGARYKAVCDTAETLLVNANGNVMDNGQVVGKLNLTVKVSLDTSTNLVQNVNGTLSGDFGVVPLDEQNNICVRK